MYSALRAQESFAYTCITALQDHVVHQAIRTNQIERYAGAFCLRRVAVYTGELAHCQISLKTIDTGNIFDAAGEHVSFASGTAEVHTTRGKRQV